MPSNFLPAETIVSWVPKPNKDFPDKTVFDNDTWIMCDGHETCKTGRFAGQVCSDLSDRVLVGAGKLGQMLDLKDATIPDHAHEHRHGGSGTYNLQYKRGPDTVSTKKKGVFFVLLFQNPRSIRFDCNKIIPDKLDALWMAKFDESARVIPSFEALLVFWMKVT